MTDTAKAPETAAASDNGDKGVSTTPEQQANIAASEKAITEVHQTEQQQQQQQKFDACVAQSMPELPKGQNLLDALTSSTLDKKLGGDCAATDRVADLHRELLPQNDKQQVKVETHPDGTRLESRFENGKLIAQRSVFGDTTTLRTYDADGNLTTVTEKGTGENRVQTWTFPDGDNLRIKADGSFQGEINGVAVAGKGKAQIEAFFKLALADQNYVPDLSKDSFGSDLHGSAVIINGDKRTGAVINKGGDLNIFTADSSGVAQRNVVSFNGDTMTLHGPDGAVTSIKAQTFKDGVYTFSHNGIEYSVQGDKVQKMFAARGNVDQTITKGPNGWNNESVEHVLNAEGARLQDNKVRTFMNENNEILAQIMDGDKPVQTTVITLEQRVTYKGDGSDRSPENLIARTSNGMFESPEIVRQGNRAFDATGVYSDKDHFGPGVYYDVVSGRNITNTQLLQFASFVSAMSNQVSACQNFFESVAVGANYLMGQIDSGISKIQAFMGYVNCNVNGSRFLGMLPMANMALEAGNAARDRAGICKPDPMVASLGFQDIGLVARTASDVNRTAETPRLALINGGDTYRDAREKDEAGKNTLPDVILYRTV